MILGALGGEWSILRLLHFVAFAVFAIFYGRLEILDAFAQALAQAGKFARSKDKKGNGKQQQDLR